MCTQSIGELHALPLKSAGSNWLMCFPEFYDVQYIINPWMEGNLHAASRVQAIEQWRGLYNAISGFAHVELISPEPGLPDMVFTANAGLERDGIVVSSHFLHTERRREESFFREWFKKKGYTIADLPQEMAFEGEGDALFSNNGTVLWVGCGMRTDRRSHPLLAHVFDAKVTSLHLVDPRFYHLDTCFAPLADGFVLYYPAAFDSKSLQRIHSFYPQHKRISVSEEDACRFACNAISIGQTIVLNEISRELTSRLENAGFRVLSLRLDEFLKAGGAAKCLVMRLGSPATASAPASPHSSSSMDLSSAAPSTPESEPR
jgi:N-dimethylarginine dimethylaminohydrolase